jgi:hypothetical protein
MRINVIEKDNQVDAEGDRRDKRNGATYSSRVNMGERELRFKTGILSDSYVCRWILWVHGWISMTPIRNGCRSRHSCDNAVHAMSSMGLGASYVCQATSAKSSYNR